MGADVLSKFRRRGAADLADAALSRGGDRLLGVRTGDFVSLDDVGDNAPNRIWHAPSDWVQTWVALRRAGATPEDVLLDYGCGKGRALVVARMLPFRRLYGVDVSPALVEVARANLRRRSPLMRTPEFEVVVADAAAWDVPDDVTVVFGYCPFTGPVFAGAIDRLLASVDRRPRRVRFVYSNPFEHNFLLRTGRFRPIDVIRGQFVPRQRERRVIVTYEIVAPGVPAAAGPRGRIGPWSEEVDRAVSLPAGFETASAPHASTRGAVRS